jgi:hypothetical protein
MTKPYYNPRNRNERTHRNAKSWSDAFDDHAVHRHPDRPVGFQVPERKP